VGFEVGGRLEKVRVKKGQEVQEGQVLAQLNAEISDAQLAQAQAAVAAAQVGAAMAADVAERNAKLQEQGNVSDLQNLTSTTQARQAEAQLLAAKAQLAQAQAGRRKHDLKAPFAGTVIDAPEQVGAIVGPGVPLFSLENLDTLLLKTTVAESLRSRLKPGTRVRVEVLGGTVSTDEAVIRTVIASADPATRRIPVDIAVPNKDGRFVANTLARVILPLGEAQEAQVVPSTALASLGGDHVFVVSSSGEVRRVGVQVLERRTREVVVKASTPLDKVVEFPTPALAEGTRVSVK
jgi:RND family efflux transporter MFP subunit